MMRRAHDWTALCDELGMRMHVWILQDTVFTSSLLGCEYFTPEGYKHISVQFYIAQLCSIPACCSNCRKVSLLVLLDALGCFTEDLLSEAKKGKCSTSLHTNTMGTEHMWWGEGSAARSQEDFEINSFIFVWVLPIPLHHWLHSVNLRHTCARFHPDNQIHLRGEAFLVLCKEFIDWQTAEENNNEQNQCS